MMIDARRQDDLIAALHFEPLFKSAQFESKGANGQRTAHADSATDHSQRLQTGHSYNLSVLLQELGVAAAPASTWCIGQTATARAAAKIAEWMTYLSKDCVKAMVNNGWHWST